MRPRVPLSSRRSGEPSASACEKDRQSRVSRRPRPLHSQIAEEFATLGGADAPDEARNCAVADVELVLPTKAEVVLVRPTPAALPAPRLCDAYNRGLVGPTARRDRSPPPKTKAKVSGRSPSTRSCIGITGAVDRREHRRRRCRHRLIQACAVPARHDCFGSPASPSHACAMPRLR